MLLKLKSVLYPREVTAIDVSLLSGCCLCILRDHITHFRSEFFGVIRVRLQNGTSRDQSVPVVNSLYPYILFPTIYNFGGTK